MSDGRYPLKMNSGKVLIVRNQRYHREHNGENVPDKELDACERCYNTDVRGCTDSVLGCIKKEDKNIQALVDTFTALGFKDIYGGVDKFVVKDKSKKEMIDLLKKAAETGFEDYYCFICVVLSYGKDGVITCVDDSRDGNVKIKNPTPSMMLPVSELQECLKGYKCLKGDECLKEDKCLKEEKCLGLLMKPKIFLLQLESVPKDMKDAPKGGVEPTKQLKIPREADFLMYNCETDYAIEAWIQGLNDHVRDKIKNKEEPMEIQRLLTRMNSLVRKYYTDKGLPDMELPCVTSLLTKEVYLGKRIQQ